MQNATADIHPPSAHAILDAAGACMGQRASEYDQPAGERSMAATVAAFNAITGRDLAESDGWLFMTLLKLVRGQTAPGYHADSAIDAAAYTALLGESRARAAAQPPADRPPTDRELGAIYSSVTSCSTFIGAVRALQERTHG